MSRQKTTVFEQLKQLARLPVTPPTGVHGKPVKNWDQRRSVATGFFDQYDRVKENIKVNTHKDAKPVNKNGWIYEVTDQPNTFIQREGSIDGALLARERGQASRQKPLMVIAANKNHIGGSSYRTGRQGKTGDAQEEQANNTYAGALALASFPKVSKGVKAGEICYTDEFSEILSNRGAIEITNVPSIKEGQVCDQLLVAAPDLKKKKECFTKTGEFDYQKYQNEIYLMYSNLFSAIVKQASDSDQPIILTLPGAGVFLGEDENVKKQAIIIQGLCLRRVLNEQDMHLVNRKFCLPYAQSKDGVNAQIMNIVDSEPDELRVKIAELQRLQMAQKNKMFATLLEILDDAEVEAKKLVDNTDGEKIIKNINEIREKLLDARPALNGETKKTNLDKLSKEITGLAIEILPTAAKHGGLKQDLMNFVAAMLDFVFLSLPKSASKVGVEGNLVKFTEKFGLFKQEMLNLAKEEAVRSLNYDETTDSFTKIK